MTLKNIVKFALYINDDNQGDLANRLNSYQPQISDALKNGNGSCPDHLRDGITIYTEEALLAFLKTLLPEWSYSTERKTDGLRVYINRYIQQKWEEAAR